MRFGIDGVPLATPKTGVGHYTFELARSLALLSPTHDFELVSHAPFINTNDTADPLPNNLRRVRIKANPLTARWWALGLPLYLRQANYNLFHGTNYEVPWWTPPGTHCPVVVSIHDLSLFLHAATHENRLVKRARRRIPLVARRASMILTHAETVKREICEHLGVSANKVVAIPAAPRRVFCPASAEQMKETKRRLVIEDEFVLYVGTIEPRKNLITLIRAFDEILRSTELRPQLVIAGREGWLTDELFSVVKASGTGKHLRFTGYITDEDLRSLYSSCRVCVYPSLYEGFGLPPLEAMACGAPVITSRIETIVETVGTAARLVDPLDVRALAASIIRVLEDQGERRHLSEIGLERAREFTWERTARLTMEVYNEVLKMS